ncbi:hypothetical protein ACJX0J_009263, partial [Zea mays]
MTLKPLIKPFLKRQRLNCITLSFTKYLKVVFLSIFVPYLGVLGPLKIFNIYVLGIIDEMLPNTTTNMIHNLMLYLHVLKVQETGMLIEDLQLYKPEDVRHTLMPPLLFSQVPVVNIFITLNAYHYYINKFIQYRYIHEMISVVGNNAYCSSIT